MDRTGAIFETGRAGAYFITSPVNIEYACGFSGDDSELLLLENGGYLFTDSRYDLSASRALEGTSVEVVVTNSKERLEAVSRRLTECAHGVLGIEKQYMTVDNFERLRRAAEAGAYVDISEALLRMRAVKSEEEIEKIVVAAQATQTCLERALPSIRAGVRESDIRAELLYEMFKMGMDSSFEPIVAAGANGAMPHATVTDYALREGDLLTIDFGCRYEGYCADMTRTFAIGQIDDDLKRIYDVVEHAQKAALDAARIGVCAAEVDAAARESITRSGYGEYFGHGVGHGVGLQIHELPVLNAFSTDVLGEGMAYTIEPGVYVPGLGGVRIEDTCVAGRGSLFSFPKTLIRL